MTAPFVFQSEVGAVRSTGYRADDLESFIHGLERVSGSSIYYHFFRSVLRRHFMSTDFVHDFARWALVSLSLPPLAERLAQLDPVEHAILWLGLTELRAHPEIPVKVVINEAVQLAKEFGATDGHRYINALLDKVAPKLRPAA